MSCKTGKTGYKTAQEAQRISAKMNDKRRRTRRKLTGHAPARVYKCNECGEYHVTGAKNKMKKIKVKYIPTEEQIEVRHAGN